MAASMDSIPGLQMGAELVGGWCEIFGDYPAWAYKADSKLREIMVKKYREMYGKVKRYNSFFKRLQMRLPRSMVQIQWILIR